MKRYILPLGGFAALLVFLGVGLRLKPQEIPSPLIGKPARDMRGKVWILNVWASWCGPCRAEHPALLELSRLAVAPVVGLNYNDLRGDSQRWLKEFGNPYQVAAFDGDGTTGIEFGVYGVPETFVIDRQGLIRLKLTGPVTSEQVRDKLVPLVRELNHG